MDDLILFQAPDGTLITSSRILSWLDEVGAADVQILYMHSGITFGTPNPRLSRQELLGCLYEITDSLGVPTLCVPTFTFSFCNGEDYHVQNSRCRMGALNEYVRKLPNALRSRDPLLSNALIGEDHDLVENLGKQSIGAGSTFDKLHRRGGRVKFLFFGASLSECFTYTHYVEERLRAPFRYHRQFAGLITDGGRTWHDVYTLFVRYQGVKPALDGVLESELLR